ncbi:hypothetical protein KVT40_004276 [Elsinoe batatas]|uniref:5-aminolevulinate synthase, mitochondrial n=1 Tax=Elsinoe batatas TaxID=2601811 RepID=A0A8K0L9Z1_9PEZI|nr:hypothetical protein KVT40_004276 [Elsinoe batatas]
MPAIPRLREAFPELYVIADVSLCEYTDHGHCAITFPDGSVDNEASVARISDIALSFARAGVHCVAPSDMSDGRIRAIKLKLLTARLESHVAIMSYSAKFASCLYGPFREAAASTPAFGDRKRYLLPPPARGLARKAIERDLQEGADMIMIKPAYPDIISDAKALSHVPVTAMQVSGEFATIHAAARAGVYELKAAAFEATEIIVVNVFQRQRDSGYYRSLIDGKKRDHSYRSFRSIKRIRDHFPFAHCSHTGKKVNVWCSNDYLAMGSHKAVTDAMTAALATYGANSGGSRNIAGHSPLVEELEWAIARLHRKPSALYFSSGFSANEAALSTLGTQLPGCVIFSDELNHASMIDGIRHSKAKRHVWRHNDMESLESLLAGYPMDMPKIIAFESVYSMCGTIAPIQQICDLAREYGAITFMDECHAIGLYGPHGAGIAEHLDYGAHCTRRYDGTTTMDRVDIIAGSTSKGLGTMGGYVAGSAQVIDLIRSFARGFIFTTTQSPAVMAGALAAVENQYNDPSGRIALQRNVLAVKQKMAERNLPVLPNRSHLVPLMVGDAALTRQLAELLFDEYHVYAQPINSPTVAIHQERLRISPTGFHSSEQQDILVDALMRIWERLGLRRASDWVTDGAWSKQDAMVDQLWTNQQLGLPTSRHAVAPCDVAIASPLEDTLIGY